MVNLRIFRSSGVSDSFVRRQLRFAGAYFEPFGIRFALGHDPEPVDFSTLFVPGPPATTQGWEPLSEGGANFLEQNAVPPRQEILVVFLLRVLPQHSSLRKLLPHLTGLTLVPGVMDEHLPSLLTSTTTWNPVIFVSVTDVERLAVSHLPSTLAHEVGHALGLAHVSEPENLMSPRPHSCTPGLTLRQQQLLRQHRLAGDRIAAE